MNINMSVEKLEIDLEIFNYLKDDRIVDNVT